MINAHNRGNFGGFSLVEVMVAMVVLSICIIFAAASITQSRKALKQAELVQVATAYATNLIEEIKGAPPPVSQLPKTDLDQEVTVGQKRFHVTRSIYLVDTYEEYSTQQVVVNVTWSACTRPLVFSEIILSK